ncbi:hypothetical protein BGZ98_006284, partial [Dissophora globulifera]
MEESESILQKVKQLGPRNANMISRLYPRKMAVIEKLLLLEFKSEVAARIPVNDARLREMAVMGYYEMYPIMDPAMAPRPFMFSDGWLSNFKRNNNIRMQTGH